ncbi:MAG: hypothetical protein ACRDD7_12145 [Peptostreptococcaceae bacterium]
MKKYFNTTGLCIKNMHYMVDIENKINQIIKLINRDSYFVINRPRQYGKTTTLNSLEQILSKNYLVISISFEGIGDKVFESEEDFSKEVLTLFGDSIELNYEEEANLLYKLSTQTENLRDLSRNITKFIKNINKEVILFIDEVDKSSNNQVFISFLGMLRNKYLNKMSGKDYTFKSVILAGVHDIKNLKLSIRENEEIKYNSPWNIAVNFDIDMSFNIKEIESMIIEYNFANDLDINTNQIAKDIYYYTNGYPFLVSRLCQIIDENIMDNKKISWTEKDIENAVKIILKEKNTLFESLIKNMENDNEIYNLIKEITLNGTTITYNSLNPLIDKGIRYGVFKEYDNRLIVNNRIYEQIIYNYMISKIETNEYINTYNHKKDFITTDNGLDINKVLLKYQQFVKEQYSNLDSKFIEREGRLLFLAVIKPIINGVGFDIKEVQISEEKRLDVVITYNTHKYVVELKIWNGKEYHEKGLKQLVDYLDIQNLGKGYLLVYNFNKKKEYTHEVVNIEGKEIFIVYV